jgi:hypothetical protein
MRFSTLLFILLLYILEVNTSADILVVYNQGNTPLPITGDISASNISSLKLSATQESDISMDEEIVRIERTDIGNILVTCSFMMRSHSDKERTRLIGFPVIDSRNDAEMARTFKVKLDNKSVPTKVYMLRESTWEEKFGLHEFKDFNYSGYVVWPVSWKPKQTIQIICTYDAGEALQDDTDFAEFYYLQYVVRTGALWKGPIGKARISIKHLLNKKDIKFDGQNIINLSGKYKLQISYPENVEWASNDEIVWQFKNWEPDKDIVIKKAKWLGFHKGYFFRPPTPYQGDSIKYTYEMLDSIIEKELSPWKEMFPLEVENMDKMPLKKHIAELLFHEITARHGDAFILGKVGDGPKPIDVDDEDENFYYGKWNVAFKYFSHHSGWYHPDVNKTISDKDLNDYERANRAFLKPLCSE